ncbi:hypothetical protein F5B21DRAFT_476528 [Xylaria acuta]|nr:hypothetical protein F5B21DRAFT_476528 [Xylaria acuta]
MNPNEQKSVAAAIAEAVGKLHCSRLQLSGAGEIISNNSSSSATIDMTRGVSLFGGPHTGFLVNGYALLDAVMQRRKLRKDFCTKHHVSERQGIIVQSNFEELGSVFIKTSEIEQWPNEAVFCHNDLTPRNIIIQSRTSSNGSSYYKLAAIIDWELAGFYPPSYELSLQDTYLSGGNRRLSFYLLLKKHLKELVPRSSSQIALCQAMELVWESRHQLLYNGNNIPAHIRKRFLEKFCLIRDQDPYIGWVRDSKKEGPWDCSREAAEKLEDDVIEEILAKRSRP